MFFGDNVDGYDANPCTKNKNGVISIRPLNLGQSSIIDEVQTRRGLDTCNDRSITTNGRMGPI